MRSLVGRERRRFPGIDKQHNVGAQWFRRTKISNFVNKAPALFVGLGNNSCAWHQVHRFLAVLKQNAAAADHMKYLGTWVPMPTRCSAWRKIPVECDRFATREFYQFNANVVRSREAGWR